MSKETNKPLVIQLREAKEAIVGSINKATRGGIPCYLLEPIIANIYAEVRNMAQAEYEQAQKQYAGQEHEQEKKGVDPE